MARWLLTYSDQTVRIVWSEYREILPSGALAFYNVREGAPTPDHIYVVAPGVWRDVMDAPTDAPPDSDHQTLGHEPREQKKRRT